MDKPPRRPFVDLDHPIFRKLWARLFVTAMPLGWGVFEMVAGNPGFGVLFLAAGAWSTFHFLTRFNPRDEP